MHFHVGGPEIRLALIGGFAGVLALPAGAQAADEHAAHHSGDPPTASGAPGMALGAAVAAPAATRGDLGMAPGAPMAAAGATTPGAPGMMAGGGMGDMMGKKTAPAAAGACMGGDCGSVAAKTPIYPSLMTLPALAPEKRAEIDALASQQINEGMERHAKGAESHNRATLAGDHAAMQESVGMMREGLDELGAGIAARRVLSEGKAPRNLALDWFKREMNLASPVARQAPRPLFGVPPFHLFTMVLLAAFALAMIFMYFFKMRRTAALFGRLEGGSGQPPPGSSPPLAGTTAPVTDSVPPEGASSAFPASAATPAPPTPTPPKPSV